MEQINNDAILEWELQSPQERVMLFKNLQALQDYVMAFGIENYNCRKQTNGLFQLVFPNLNGE
jgi:hypothetical protein